MAYEGASATEAGKGWREGEREGGTDEGSQGKGIQGARAGRSVLCLEHAVEARLTSAVLLQQLAHVCVRGLSLRWLFQYIT